MNEKIEKIKKQFEDQSSTVDSIRRVVEDSLRNIRADIAELKEVSSVDRPELAIADRGRSIEASEKKLDFINAKQEELETKIGKVIQEINELKEASSKNDDMEKISQ